MRPPMPLFLLPLLLLAGCATTPPPAAEAGNTVSFRCERGTALTVTFFRDYAMLSANGEAPLRLEAERVASGYGYIAPMRSIRGKGKDLTYNFARTAPEACTEIEN